MKKLISILAITVFIIPAAFSQKAPANQRYISVYEVKEEILGDWNLIAYNKTPISKEKDSHGAIIRFEDDYIYAESLPNKEYYEGEWQIIEHNNQPYVVLWTKREIFKVVFFQNNLYLVDILGNFFEFKRILG